MADNTGNAFDIKIFSRLMGFAKRYRLYFFTAAFATILLSFFAAARPYILKLTIDEGVIPKDSNALAEEIKKLIASPETCHKMGMEGRKMAEDRFDEKITIERHLSIYDQVLFGREQ